MTTSTETGTEVLILLTPIPISTMAVTTIITLSQMMIKATTDSPPQMTTTLVTPALEISATGMRAQTSAMLMEINTSTELSSVTIGTPTAATSTDQVATWPTASDTTDKRNEIAGVESPPHALVHMLRNINFS